MELRLKHAGEPLKFLENEIDLLSLVREVGQVGWQGGGAAGTGGGVRTLLLMVAAAGRHATRSQSITTQCPVARIPPFSSPTPTNQPRNAAPPRSPAPPSSTPS
jgi:hypothetical protein